MRQIFLHHRVGHLTNRGTEVASGPDVSPPVALFEHGEFLEQLARGASLDPAHDFARGHVRRGRDEDVCLHRGTRLSLGKVTDGLLACPYHGWTYDMTGRCVRIPAHPDQPPPPKAVVKTYRVQERYELIWVALGQPAHDIPPFPEWDKAAYRKILCGPYQI